MERPHWKTVGRFLTKLNISLPHSLAMMALGIYRKELNTDVHAKIFPYMFTPASFIIPEAGSSQDVVQQVNG